MSKPTPQDALYAWHANALLTDVERDDRYPTTDDPQCGWFQRRLVKDGIMVPARIWMDQPTDDEGDLVADEVLRCEVNGEYAKPEDQWTWLCGNPIRESDFHYMMARKAFAEEHAPHEPAANPRQPINWLDVPTPTFGRTKP